MQTLDLNPPPGPNVAAVAAELLACLEDLVESHGYTSYLSDDEKESEPEVLRARAAIASAWGLRLPPA